MDDANRPPPAQPPRLPVRASIYIAPDGSVQFGALFAELLPVARALGALAGDALPPQAAPVDERDQ